MPDKKKKPKRSKEQAKADRIYKHYKAMKRTWDKEFVRTTECEGCVWSSWPHWHGHNVLTTPNEDWLRLAHEHKMTVREIKDIVTARRDWNREDAIEKQAGIES